MWLNHESRCVEDLSWIQVVKDVSDILGPFGKQHLQRYQQELKEREEVELDMNSPDKKSPGKFGESKGWKVLGWSEEDWEERYRILKDEDKESELPESWRMTALKKILCGDIRKHIELREEEIKGYDELRKIIMTWAVIILRNLHKKNIIKPNVFVLCYCHKNMTTQWF